MNKKIALYFASVLLAGCVAQQPYVRRDAPAHPVASQAPMPQPQGAMQAPRPTPVAASLAPVRVASPQTVHAVEDAVACRVPMQMGPLRTRMEREALLGAPSKDGEHALRAPMLVYGLPVKSVMFNGDDEGDSGKVISVTVDGNVQSAVKAAAAKGLHPKWVRKSGSYMLRTRNGTFDIMAAKTGTIIGCSVGWD